MRVVLDRNVLISAGLNAGICRTVLYEVLEILHQCILSTEILREYVTVARRKRFARAEGDPYFLDPGGGPERCFCRSQSSALRPCLIPKTRRI